MRLCNKGLKFALILSALCGAVALTACGGVQEERNDSTEELELSVWLDGYSGDLVFYSAPAFMGYYENISYMNPACERIFSAGETPALITFPTVDGSAPSPNVNYLVLVNANTENKEAAKLFIESAVGIESQYLCGMSWGIPVNTGLVKKLRDFYVDGKVDEKYTFNDDCVLPADFAKRYFDAIDSLDDGVYIDVMTSGRLFSVVREYCSNGGDISAALESGKKNVSLYLSE